MKIGWLADDPGYIGGAELTMAEFRAAAPVEVVDGIDADVVVVGNCMRQKPDLNGQRVIQYHHDVRKHNVEADVHIYCSPLQREHMEGDGPTIPPAVDLEPFRKAREASQERAGAVWVGVHSDHPDKGFDLAQEWGEVDAYDSVPYEEVPDLLGRYETFVHLPRAIEPFGRTVVEAWAAGCKVVVNRNVGALHWINEAPEKLETAAGDFWEVVLS